MRIIVFIFIFICNNVFAAENNSSSMETFYKKPSLVRLVEIVKNLEEELSRIDNKQYVMGLLNCFVTSALYYNPDIQSELLSNISNYSDGVKSVFTQALINLDNPQISDKLVNKNKLEANFSVEKFNKLNLKKVIKNYEELSFNSNSTDLFWVAFYASGKKLYIEKIVNFLASAPNEVRLIAFEMFNRDVIQDTLKGMGVQEGGVDYKDIFESTKGLYSPYYLISYKIILWSLNSNQRKFPEIKKIADSIHKFPEVKL